MGAISTRPTIRGHTAAIYCTMVSADTLVGTDASAKKAIDQH
jgi:hypothetical protein